MRTDPPTCLPWVLAVAERPCGTTAATGSGNVRAAGEAPHPVWRPVQALYLEGRVQHRDPARPHSYPPGPMPEARYPGASEATRQRDAVPCRPPRTASVMPADAELQAVRPAPDRHARRTSMPHIMGAPTAVQMERGAATQPMRRTSPPTTGWRWPHARRNPPRARRANSLGWEGLGAGANPLLRLVNAFGEATPARGLASTPPTGNGRSARLRCASTGTDAATGGSNASSAFFTDSSASRMFSSPFRAGLQATMYGTRRRSGGGCGPGPSSMSRSFSRMFVGHAGVSLLGHPLSRSVHGVLPDPSAWPMMETVVAPAAVAIAQPRLTADALRNVQVCTSLGGSRWQDVSSPCCGGGLPVCGLGEPVPIRSSGGRGALALRGRRERGRHLLYKRDAVAAGEWWAPPAAGRDPPLLRRFGATHGAPCLCGTR